MQTFSNFYFITSNIFNNRIRYPTVFSSRILVSNLACNTSNPNHLTIYHCPRTSGPGLFCTHCQDVALVCSTPYSTGINIILCKYSNLLRYYASG